MAASADSYVRAGTELLIKLINLDRSPDRLAEFTRVNAHLGDVSRFAAVDGKTLDIDALARIRLLDPRIIPPYTMGAVG